MTNQIKHLTLPLPNANAVDIHVGNSFITDIDFLKSVIPSKRRLFIITQDFVYEKHGKHIEDTIKKEINDDCHLIKIPDGESAKSFQVLQFILNKMFEIGVERHDLVVAIGGGVITDCAGFVASICLRGLELINIPTTLLAQVDAAIGGKTGINHFSGKNLIGSFYQPSHVILDVSFLSTLPLREFYSGFAEVIKYGVIRDPELFEMLLTHRNDIKKFSASKHPSLWEDIVYTSCKNKVDVVKNDEKESNLRAILNFGHTIGHGIEALFDYHTYKHGECVIFGMCAATHIAEQKSLISKEESQRIYSLIEAFGYFSLKLEPIDYEKLLPIISRDKKVKGNVIHFILPKSVGDVMITDTVSQQEIEGSLLFIQSLFKGAKA
ncbi:3-dehydroquinate synthase [Candidatus Marinamargulisbacteria bacterium SCGC AG-343-D04]|nr:3-dehydroquinate synthase [Candidatus Marinamargulisbacteria bacterium SCGC AG-343-D04]